MIDPSLLRDSPDAVRAALTSRGGRYLPALEELLTLDQNRRSILKEVEVLRARRNAISQEIGKAKAAKNEEEFKRLQAQVAADKKQLADLEGSLTGVSEKARLASLSIPNLPHASAPVGSNETQNVEKRKGISPRTFSFAPKDHQSLGEALGLLDFPAAALLSGSRFSLWKGKGPRLMRGLISFALDLHEKAGYQEILPPALVRPEILEGTGQLPKFEADLYKTSGGEGDARRDLYLIPTAEVPLTNLVREQTLAAEKLPLKFSAYTPCFRQEAGSYGKDVRGLIRNHQFDKVELVWITKPEDSLAALETLTQDAERVLTTLEIPHRVIELCTGDMGFSAMKTYDLEVWMPADNKYREISSCSNCGDFQARRIGAKLKRGAASPEFVHTLNGSGVAIGRLFAAILENFQQQDGSVVLPKALVPYAGFDRLSL